MPTYTSVILMLSLSISCAAPHAAQQRESAHPTRAEHAFAEMKSYVGSWGRVGISRDQFQIQFNLTAKETVLVETWMRGAQVHSLTVYHLDEERLLATHYCPQGNQPRLALVENPANDALIFEFVDGTSIKSSGNPYQSGATFSLSESGNSMVRGEVYTHDGVDSPSSITLQRFETELP